jgi:hypothetical protein
MRWRLRGWSWPTDDDDAELDRLLAETWEAAAAATGGLLDIQAGKAALLAAAAQQAARPSGSPAPSAASAAGQTARPADPRPGRRRLTARVAAAAGAVAVLIAVAVAGAAGAFSTRNAQQIQTDAFVARVRHALAAQAGGGLVGYSRNVLAPGTVVEPVPDSWGTWPGGAGSPRSGLAAAVMISWTYQSESTMTALDAAGQPVATEQNTAGWHGGSTTVAVDYRGRTWWRATLAPLHGRPGHRPPVQPRCSATNVIPASETWQAFIRQELSCGAFTEDGRQRVDGIDAIKLTGSNGEVLWIDPSTYLPVRQAGGPGDPGVTDFRWYRATPASLANLKVIIPAGFRRVAPPRLPLTKRR